MIYGWNVYDPVGHGQAIRRLKPSCVRLMLRPDQVNPRPGVWVWPDEVAAACAATETRMLVAWHGNATSWLPHQSPSARANWPTANWLLDACNRAVRWIHDRGALLGGIEPWNEADLASSLGQMLMGPNFLYEWEINWLIAFTVPVAHRYVRFGLPARWAAWTGGVRRLADQHMQLAHYPLASGGIYHDEWVRSIRPYVTRIDVHAYGRTPAQLLHQVRARIEPWDNAAPDDRPLPFFVGEAGSVSSYREQPLDPQAERRLLQTVHHELANIYGARYLGMIYHTADIYKSRIVDSGAGWWTTS